MSGRRSNITRPRITAKFEVRLPGVSVSRSRKEPRGWGRTEIRLRTAATQGISNLAPPKPYPDPPADWPGTEPEWAINWALTTLGLQRDVDFYYTPAFNQDNISYFTTLDFFLPDYFIGIEVQGEFWHYEQGPERVMRDIARQQVLSEFGITVVYIDGEHAEANPIYYTEEALQGKDHSAAASSTGGGIL